jgi:hypothetical protein
MKEMQIIASGITTLDDARYFAAMGADWIGLDFTKLSVDEIKTIAEWIVGPKIFVEITDAREELLFEITQKMRLHGICIPLETNPPSWYEGKVIRRTDFSLSMKKDMHPGQTIMLCMNSIPGDDQATDTLHSIASERSCWVDIGNNPSPAILIPWLNKLSVQGIVIRVDAKNAAGEPDYADYDLIFDAIGN